MRRSHSIHVGSSLPSNHAVDRRLFGVLLAVLAIGTVALSVPGGASARIIQAPKQDAHVDEPTRVAVKVGRGSVYAWLNGRRVERQLVRSTPMVRGVRVGAAEGLRRGRNVLRVRRETERRARVERRVFWVDGNGPIAGISARGEHAAGVPLNLRAHGPEKRRWCLVAAPRGTSLAPESCRKTAQRQVPGDGVEDNLARATTFTPDVPGAYRVELTTGSGGAKSTDAYTVTAGPQAPTVSFQLPTNTSLQFDSIDVGDDVYGVEEAPAGSDFSLLAAQVVVLDRDTLELEDPTATGIDTNHSYYCTTIPGPACDQLIAGEIEKDIIENPEIDDGMLVMVSASGGVLGGQTPSEQQGFVGPKTLAVLEGIGVDPAESFPTQDFSYFAAVGIPKSLKPGEAWVLHTKEPSYLAGSLVRDQDNKFRPTPVDNLPLTVRSESTGASNAMDVFGQAQNGALPDGATGGFQMVVVDGYSGIAEVNEVVPTNFASGADVGAGLGAWDQALAAVKGAMAPGYPDVLLVASLGSPSGHEPGMPGNWYAAWDDLASFIEQNGGTEHGVLSIKPGEPYALASRTQSGPASGTEVGPAAIAPAHSARWKQSGALAGSMAVKDDDWRFEARVGTGDVLDPSSDVSQMLWPDEEQPFPQYDGGAMNYIYGQVFAPNAPCDTCTGDVRQFYWTQDWTGDLDTLANRWNGYRITLTNLHAPAGAPFADGFAAAKAGVQQELQYLENATNYLNELGTPFSGDASTAIGNNVSAIQNGIQHLNLSASVGISWTKALADALDVGSLIKLDPELEDAGNALSTLATGINAAGDLSSLAQSGTSGSEDTFQAQAGQFGATLTGRLQNVVTGYKAMIPIVAHDWGKLQAFGKASVCPSTNPSCQAGFQLTSAETTQAVDLWIGRQAWQTLMPAAVGTLAWHGSYAQNQVPDASNWHCWKRTDTGPDGTQSGDDLQPLANMPATGQAALASSVGPAGPAYDLWALGTWNRSGQFENTATPSAAQTNGLFAEVDPDPADPSNPAGNPNYGLGFVPAHFMKAYPGAPYSALDGNPSNDFRGFKTGYCKFGPIPASPPPR